MQKETCLNPACTHYITQGRRRGFGSGTTEGRCASSRRLCSRGVRGCLPGKFCKKDTKSCVLGTSGTLLAQCVVESSTVGLLSTTADAWQIYEYESRKRSKSDAHMHRWILIFFITVLHVSDGPHFSKSGTANGRSGCYAPVTKMM